MAGELDVDDVGDVVDELATGTYVVTRREPTQYLDGRRQPPTTSTFEVLAVVQAATARQLERLPEGLRTHETLSLWSRTQLRTADTGGEPDLVTVRGLDYQVAASDNWDAAGAYFRHVLTKVSSR